MMKAMAFYKRLLWFVWLASLSACSTLPGKPEPPRVNLVGLQLVSMELFEQRYEVRLRLKNPNAYELPITGIDFRLDINGQAFADGVSNRSVTVPAYGEQVIALEVSSNLIQVFRQLQLLEKSRSPGFEYRINGSVAVGDTGRRLPFDYSGDMQLSRPAPPTGSGGV
jgi:LEA14-like dessication related protein